MAIWEAVVNLEPACHVIGMEMGGKDGSNKRYDNRCSGQTAVWLFAALNVGECFSTVLYDCGYDHCGTGSVNEGAGIHWRS